MNKKYYYKVVLYNNNYVYPINFKTREKADDFIFENNLYAFITIEKGEK